MLAACWSVDVIKGAFGFTFTGFLTISDIFNSVDSIKDFIFSASSFWRSGSDFFLLSANGIIFWSDERNFIETSQYSSGINSWISLSLSSKTLNATDWTLPAERPLAIFFQSRGDSSKPITLSRNLLALYAFTRSKSISFGSAKESIIADLVIWLKRTLE